MRPLIALLAFISVVALAGCNPTPSPGGWIAFTNAAIPEPENADFGFDGKWRSAPDPIWDDPRQPKAQKEHEAPAIITRAVDGTYSFAEPVMGARLTFRAISLSDPGFVLVEVEARPVDEDKVLQGQPNVVRFLVVANRQGDDLFFQHLRTAGLEHLMALEGYTIEISPPGLLLTRVDAEPAELLDCVKKHWRELVHEPTTHWIREER
jgi:hypothetical protein